MNNDEPTLEPEVNPFAERARQNAEEAPPPIQSVETPLPASRVDQIMVSSDGQMQLCNIEQVWRAARLIRQSGLVPQSFRNDQQLVVAILRALELKIPVFQALEGMTVISGRIGIMGDLALALVHASGELKDCSKEYSGEGDEYTCTVTLQRKGRKPHTYSFSVAQAKKAGIYERSAVWRSYPDRMTYYRALGFGLRDEFPDILRGIKTVEELADYPDNGSK